MLEVIGLGKTFILHLKGQKTLQVLEDISFSLSAGEFLGITGPSGIGKSTILKCIYRTYIPTRGQIWYDSQKWGRLDLAAATPQIIVALRRQEIGYVSQFLRVIPRVSTLDIVAEPLLAQNGVSPTAARRQAAALLERLHISPKLFEAYPTTFSGGEQQRINIARAVIWRPRLLLLDEPTASLDPQATANVLHLLEELKQQGTAIVGIFHHLDPVAAMLDRVYELPARTSPYG